MTVLNSTIPIYQMFFHQDPLFFDEFVRDIGVYRKIFGTPIWSPFLNQSWQQFSRYFRGSYPDMTLSDPDLF